MSESQQHPKIHPEYLVERTFLTMDVDPIVISSVQFFLYGIYIFIFRIAIVALKDRPGPGSRERQFHVLSLTLLFILATVNVPLKLLADILFDKLEFWAWEGLPIQEEVYRAWLACQICEFAVLLLVGLVSDTVMVFRLFVIGGYRKRYMAIPMLAFVGADVLAFVSATIDMIYVSQTAAIICNAGLIANGALNLTLTGMIAVKIWWEAHWIQRVIGKESTKGINTVIRIVLESGLIYAAVLIVDVISNFLPNYKHFRVVGIVVQVAGITPTMIVARAHSSRHKEHDVQSSEVGESEIRAVSVHTLTQFDDVIITMPTHTVQ
ncbi:hypothetical protein L218DRAFT_1007825 [Marasmius fiardii PR-910]|nr:hypothetical protein L218DRAFT_1007825 [Marasmius fiardii PR-910]